MTEFSLWVFRQVCDEPGITQERIAARLDFSEGPHGPYKFVSASVATLRLVGYVQDVERRCSQCGRALTRHIRNVGLYPTSLGEELYNKSDKGRNLWARPTKLSRYLPEGERGEEKGQKVEGQAHGVKSKNSLLSEERRADDEYFRSGTRYPGQ